MPEIEHLTLKKRTQLYRPSGKSRLDSETDKCQEQDFSF